jgi:hypothetical protein
MKEYQLGDKYSSDFDYDGMLQKGIDSDIDWPVTDLQLLYKSFEDVNYHKEASYLYIAVYELTKEIPNIESAKLHIKMFNIECKKTKTEV